MGNKIDLLLVVFIFIITVVLKLSVIVVVEECPVGCDQSCLRLTLKIYQTVCLK